MAGSGVIPELHSLSSDTCSAFVRSISSRAGDFLLRAASRTVGRAARGAQPDRPADGEERHELRDGASALLSAIDV
jgi:hypothetical protein